MNRRGFLGSILAACAAPAIVRADALMRILPKELVVDAYYIGVGAYDVAFTSADLSLSLDDFSRRIIQPAMVALSRQVDRDVFRRLYG